MGHDVDTVVDEGLTSEKDAVLAEIACQSDRMLFTLDKGLGDIRQYVPGDHPGIVVFRLRSEAPGIVSQFVESFVRGSSLDELAGCLVIAEPGNVRVRRRDEG
jgi:predicted nuclease of predicted toxin-antitoxin system